MNIYTNRTIFPYITTRNRIDCSSMTSSSNIKLNVFCIYPMMNISMCQWHFVLQIFMTWFLKECQRFAIYCYCRVLNFASFVLFRRVLFSICSWILPYVLVPCVCGFSFVVYNHSFVIVLCSSSLPHFILTLMAGEILFMLYSSVISVRS